jgi:cobalt-precorrin-5B (C1)-methyltransferase
MPAKAIKLAEGHLNTHSSLTSFNASFAAQLALEAGYSQIVAEKIKMLTLANAISDYVNFNNDEPFFSIIKQYILKHLSKIHNNECEADVIIIL